MFYIYNEIISSSLINGNKTKTEKQEQKIKKIINLKILSNTSWVARFKKPNKYHIKIFMFSVVIDSFKKYIHFLFFCFILNREYILTRIHIMIDSVRSLSLNLNSNILNTYDKTKLSHKKKKCFMRFEYWFFHTLCTIQLHKLYL